ncbi:hypothetical protein ASC94_25250 [Massilia sp. Root418]|jgi:hypothetical protein|uniref:hypothetical protein n=1 Tax=Massilia sp. Root418 TaxID=1736532 RepID=UPI0006FCC6D4|nr:hypothetical protein [Massilia sp. Root418]KQW87809.1 hypothetical protein ASC94_25250 [Massilia sp. Root418]
MMGESTKRALLRWTHALLAIPVAGYIYGPIEELHNYAASIRYGFFPAIVLLGLWMWKGHLVRHLFARADGSLQR